GLGGAPDDRARSELRRRPLRAGARRAAPERRGRRARTLRTGGEVLEKCRRRSAGAWRDPRPVITVPGVGERSDSKRSFIMKGALLRLVAVAAAVVALLSTTGSAQAARVDLSGRWLF